MELSEINSIIEDAEKKLQTVKDMIIDYNACKNDTSRQILLAAISKYTSQFKLQSVAR